MSDDKNRLQQVGALWVKTGKNGKFYTGNVEINGEKISLLVFPARDKKNPKGPDVLMYLDDRERPQTGASRPASGKPAYKTSNTQKPYQPSTPPRRNNVQNEEDEEDPIF